MSTGNTRGVVALGDVLADAAIEPGHVDREHVGNVRQQFAAAVELQLSPVMSTGNTRSDLEKVRTGVNGLQLSPVMSTGNTRVTTAGTTSLTCSLQLSPVMSTGNTGAGTQQDYLVDSGLQLSPVMSTGNTAANRRVSSAISTSCN